MNRVIEVVGAVVVRDGFVLCVQRGPHGTLPGMWEFPGGKLEAGESAQEALAREIREELRCEIRVDAHVATTTHAYDFGIVRLATYYCTLLNGEPILTEHSAIQWLAPDTLNSLEWAPADVPAVARITADLG